MFTANDMVFQYENDNLTGGGYPVNSILLNKMADGLSSESLSESEILENLSVPAGLFYKPGETSKVLVKPQQRLLKK
jgi:hypothetical protein